MLAVCLALTIVFFSVKKFTYLQRASTQAAQATSRHAPASSNVKLVLRSVYRYSVIPGGVQSSEELVNDLVNDPVVAGHYADFEVTKARVMRLDRDEMMYVSYRIGERVFWTNKQLRIPKGETVITDGRNTARTRCGNRLSAYKMQPTSPLQPRFEAFDAAVPADIVGPQSDWSALPLAGLAAPWSPSPAEVTPPGAAEGGAIPPAYFPIVGGGGAPGGALVGVPEPSALEMLAFGLAALLGMEFRHRAVLARTQSAEAKCPTKPQQREADRERVFQMPLTSEWQ